MTRPARAAGWRSEVSTLLASDLRVAAAVFFAALFAYLSNADLLGNTNDSIPNAYLPASILGDGDLAFSPFETPFMFLWSVKGANGQDVRIEVPRWNGVPRGSLKSYAEHYQEGRLRFDGPKYYVVPTVRQRPETGEPLFVGAFGPVAGLAALPLAVIAHLAGVRLAENQAALLSIAKITAASLIAASAALICLIAAGFVSRERAVLIAAAYALGSCVWAVSSQSLWQQTPEIFLLSLGMFCMVRGSAVWMRGACAGLAFSVAAACRPTAGVVGVAAAAWLLLSDRRSFAAFVAAALPPVLALLAFNAYYFGSPLDFGQLAAGASVARYKTGSPELWQTPLWLGAAGLLVSPSRGLLIYSPFFAAAFAGAVCSWADPRYRALRSLTFAVPALWAPAFLWFDWWGGWSYGYRPIVDSAPLLAVLCVPVLGWILDRPAWRAAFVIAVAWSILVQALGAFAYSPWGWNGKVIDATGTHADVDFPRYRDRLWSFRDWQIGYLIGNWRQARAERRE